MINVRTVTFHRAHNHGSVLQAYALQTFVTEICRECGINCSYKIIDYYPEVQKKLYAVFQPGFSVKSIVKNLLALRHYRALCRRHESFNQFVDYYLNLTQRYDTEACIKQNPPEADCYISGSDQIWNVRSKDFSPVYYLDFASDNARKISFAASFGPLRIDWDKYGRTMYEAFLNRYNYISTRETGSAENVALLTGKSPEQHLDPTFLLTADEWRKIQSNANHNNGKYILLYCLEPSRKQISMARSISERLGLPVVVLRYNNKNDWFNPFIKKYDAGPCDFLSYIDNAELVLSSSFHGTAFSIIYNKPFYVFDGMQDNRISSILDKAGLTDRSLSSDADLDRINLAAPDKVAIGQFIAESRKVSAAYLAKALGLALI
ncbi:MAG: polysaccharide pyruvyl transferase family protein [Bacteroidales bacterium]|nr:polysaccharide pyruvyl transferase family protein [Bacteroidales bacterium]